MHVQTVNDMGLLVKAKTATITEATLQLRGMEPKENPIEMTRSVFPSEWFPQSGVLLTWPHAGTDWLPYLDEVTEVYVKMAYHISSAERLIIVTPHPGEVSRLLKARLPREAFGRIGFVECPTNDTWTRDHGFISVREEGIWQLMDFRFNGWGGKFEAALDNAVNRRLYASGWLKGRYRDCNDFVLEGGSIESDGRGTLMTTSRCLLNPNRNPGMSRDEIESRLKRLLHIDRIFWIDHGYLAGDDTDSHVDTLARFCPDGGIAYVQCSDRSDEHYDELRQMERELQSFRTPEGEPYALYPLPMPRPLYDDDGDRLPATYANFLVVNDKVLMPSYGSPETDEAARDMLQKAFQGYAVDTIDCSVLVRQHGSLHCSTMQLPKGIVREHPCADTTTEI